MASFSNLSKTYVKDKLSKCATMVLLVYCCLYRKRSNTINVNAEAKEQGRDMQTVDRISSAVLRGESHEGRLIGRGA